MAKWSKAAREAQSKRIKARYAAKRAAKAEEPRRGLTVPELAAALVEAERMVKELKGQLGESAGMWQGLRGVSLWAFCRFGLTIAGGLWVGVLRCYGFGRGQGGRVGGRRQMLMCQCHIKSFRCRPLGLPRRQPPCATFGPWALVSASVRWGGGQGFYDPVSRFP